MNFEQCRIFCTVFKYGSISKAAESLYITQPAVSRALQNLEKALSCRLFFRTSTGVVPTSEGKLFYRYAEQALGFLSAGASKINDLNQLLEGEIRIGVSDTLCKYYLIPFLKQFHDTHPGVIIHVTCPTTPGIIQLIKSGKIDFGIINLPYEDEQIEVIDLMDIQDCFVAGEKYRNLCGAPIPLSSLAQYPVLLLEKSSNSRLYIERYFNNNAVSVTPALELGNIDLLVRFAENDFGISCVIKNFVKDELDRGALFEIIPKEPIPPRSIGAAYLHSIPLSKAAQKLIHCLESRNPDVSK